LVRCPAKLAFAVPPNAPNPIPDYVSDEVWANGPTSDASEAPPAPGRSDPADAAAEAVFETKKSAFDASEKKSNRRSGRRDHSNSRQAQEFRAALLLLHERSLGNASQWAPYLSQLPVSYDLLSSWTDAQLSELRCFELEEKAKAQRRENEVAFETTRHFLTEDRAQNAYGSSLLTYRDIEWGLDTVRSRSFLGAYPVGGAGGRDEDERFEDSGETADAAYPPATLILPLLDAFNHHSERGGATSVHFDARAKQFTLRATRDMHVGDEATISYGARANDYLLLRFGFCVFGSKDDTVELPGCMDEMEWLMPGSAREAAMYAERGLQHAIRNARVDHEGKANSNLLWALRVLLASEEEYESLGGARGFRDDFPTGLDGKDRLGSGSQLAAEASLALACAHEMDLCGGSQSLAEDETQLAAALFVLREVETECDLHARGAEDDEFAGAFGGSNAVDGDVDAACGTTESREDAHTRCGVVDEEGNDSSYLRRLVSALEFRIGRKRILAAAMSRYSPLREPITRSGDALYAATMEGGDYDEKVG